MTIKFPNYNQARVAVYGDLMLDRYWYGQAGRISPEAPVPVVRVSDAEARPGGAANVALNVAALGSQTTLMGLVGRDREAGELQQLMAGKQIECHFYEVPDFSTVTKLRVLGQNQQLLRMDFEKDLTSYDDAALLKHYEQLLTQSDVAILSDYAKGALFNSQGLIAKACQQKVPVLVDPKSRDFSRYAGATLITPNLKEFEAVVGSTRDLADIEQKAQNLIKQHQFSAMLITRGKHGMVLVHGEGESVNLTAQAREVYDVTGAGDTVIAVIAASLAAGHSMADAAALANLAAGIVVRKLGAATVSTPELRRELQKMNDSHVGVLTEDELLLTVADARAHKEKVIMTNGCFDVLHAGHVQYLEAAKAMGDRLIVAVNDDDSVRRLKGNERPLNPLAARMDVLAGLRSVDWVVSFSEDTPARLITAVLPDVLVKGGDYQIGEIAGGDAVIANGGQVVTVPLKPGFSTTNLVTKIKSEVLA